MKPKNKLTKYEILAEPEFGKTKRIYAWINGESHCYQVTINPKDFRSWPPILAHVTNTVQPNFGVVKRLVALSTMQSVHAFEELDSNEKYIALGASCKVKVPPGGYEIPAHTKVNRSKSLKKLFYVGDLNPKSIPFLQAMQKKKLTVVYIAISGKTRPPQKVIFNEHDMKDWNLIRNYLAKLLGIPEDVQYICSIYGDVLDDASQFQHGYLYVVVPFTQQFIPMDYASLSKEINNYRRNFMLPVQPAFNTNSFARAPGVHKTSSAPKSYCPENEKLRPRKDTVKEERQKVFEPEPEPEKQAAPEKEINMFLEDGTVKPPVYTKSFEGQDKIMIFTTKDSDYIPKKLEKNLPAPTDNAELE